MAEVGIDISAQSPNEIIECDLVVTVCRDADEQYPALKSEKHHWPIADPVQ